MNQSNLNNLQVPTHERNFLISPPGSPPLDWVHVQEEGANMGGCFDLNHAIEKLTGTDKKVLDISSIPALDLGEASINSAESQVLPKIVISNIDQKAASSAEPIDLVQRLANPTESSFGDLHLQFSNKGLLVAEPTTDTILFVDHSNQLLHPKT